MPFHPSFKKEKLTSSELAVCKSTALANNSSSTGNTPSPSKHPCKHPNNFKYILTSLHSPLLIPPSTNAPNRPSSISTTSGWTVFASSTTAAVNGVLSGCSTASCKTRSTKLVRSSSSSQLSVNSVAMVWTSSCQGRMGFSAMATSCLRTRTCGGASKRRWWRGGPRRSKSSSSFWGGRGKS